MKTKNQFILLFLSLCAFSCQLHEEQQGIASTTSEGVFDNDIVFENLSNDSSSLISSQLTSNSTVSKTLLSADSDKDGISDYAEQRMGLNKNNAKDVPSLTAASSITITKSNGSVLKIPFYQTSFYQENYCVPPAPTFNRSLLQSDIDLIKSYYPSMLKIFRTAEFQDYILNKEAGKTLGLQFIQRAKNINRKIDFRRITTETSNKNVLGLSNLWSWIAINPWGFTNGLGYYNSITSAIPHEFIHHLGYTHQYDYAYGGGFKARDMFSKGKHLYKVYDIENESTYN